jgi:hypothetical protein
MRLGANLRGLARACWHCKVRCTHGLSHRRSAAEEALSVLCCGLVTGSAPGHPHAALDGAQRSLAALNGLGQGGAQRPVALEENGRADLSFISSRACEPRQHPLDTLLHRLAARGRVDGGGQRCHRKGSQHG